MTQADFMIDREQFSKLFPFYFLLDANMRVLQTGAVLARMCPQFCVGQELNDHFSLFDLSKDNAQRITPELISRRKTCIFILKSESSDLSLRLQAMTLRDPERYLFLGSPWVRALKDMKLLQLVLNDFAIHDSIVDLLQITQQYDISEKELKIHNANLEQRVADRTAELVLANSELSRVMRSKDDFLSAMSHELRTPLNAVLGLSESLAEGVYGDMNAKQVQSINTIAESGHHLLSLINDLLDIAKIGAGKMELDLTNFHVEDVCQSSLRFVLEQAQKKNIKLALIMDNKSVTLTADERRLKQILVNLLSNAVKFTDEGSVTLETKCDVESESLMFSVRDTGLGIAAEDLSRLFIPFTQLDSKLSRQYPGTGLGLTLVMKLVELHGGSVSVESKIGEGSCFAIRIPCKGLDVFTSDAAKQNKIDADQEMSLESLSENTPLILIADDNEINLMTVTDYLLANKLRVIQARDGLEAVKMVREQVPSLVLMDIQMPLMDGLDAIAHLRADDKHAAIPIIALTSRAMVGDRERCLAAGADEYMSKPVNMKQLIKTIHTHLPKDETR